MKKIKWKNVLIIIIVLTAIIAFLLFIVFPRAYVLYQVNGFSKCVYDLPDKRVINISDIDYTQYVPDKRVINIPDIDYTQYKKVETEHYSLYTNFGSIDRITEEENGVSIIFENVSVIFINKHLLDGELPPISLYERYNEMFKMTPDKLNIFKKLDEVMNKFDLLYRKYYELLFNNAEYLYEYEIPSNNAIGYQCGSFNPDLDKKTAYIVQLKNNEEFHKIRLISDHLTQEDIDVFLSTFKPIDEE
ncbi:MAG: hypothetical protein GX612_02310 [Bacteroidales bacterium]|nr:hypothetical protein [Bacteroidales bacterium]